MSIMMVRMLAVAVERANVDRTRFFAEAGLDSMSLDDIHARISLPDFKRVIRAALAVSGDPALGLHMAENMSTGSFDVVGHLIEDSGSLRDALRATIHYQRIMTAVTGLELCEDGDIASIRVAFPDPEEPEAYFAAEFAVVGMLRMLRMFAGADALPLRAAFVCPEPAHRAEYTRLFAGREQFSQAYNGLDVERSWLDRVQLGRREELHAYLQTRADQLLAKADKSLPAAERVRRWLASQPANARPTMDEIARDLGTSERSLRRRLSDERMQFSELLDEALAGHAKHMLADPQRSIEETAYALGFSTPSAFSRAFKRWTGRAPTEFRRG
jgi:AraC-like DNA-binding protein